MIRRFNYTRRRRIEQWRVGVEIYDTDDPGGAWFSASLDLDDMELPIDARVTIEAKRSRVSQRFDWGTVEDPQPVDVAQLSGMPPNPSFRVMVVASDGSNRLLALADNIKPKQADSGSESLLWMEEVELGKEVWRLEFGESDNPTMFVNSNIRGMSETARQDEAFRALVIPQVLRSILTRAVVVDDCDPDDDAGQWGEWLAFVREFCDEDLTTISGDSESDAEAKLDWIDSAVRAFAEKKFHASDQYAATRGQQ